MRRLGQVVERRAGGRADQAVRRHQHGGPERPFCDALQGLSLPCPRHRHRVPSLVDGGPIVGPGMRIRNPLGKGVVHLVHAPSSPLRREPTELDGLVYLVDGGAGHIGFGRLERALATPLVGRRNRHAGRGCLSAFWTRGRSARDPMKAERLGSSGGQPSALGVMSQYSERDLSRSTRVEEWGPAPCAPPAGCGDLADGRTGAGGRSAAGSALQRGITHHRTEVARPRRVGPNHRRDQRPPRFGRGLGLHQQTGHRGITPKHIRQHTRLADGVAHTGLPPTPGGRVDGPFAPGPNPSSPSHKPRPQRESTTTTALYARTIASRAVHPAGEQRSTIPPPREPLPPSLMASYCDDKQRHSLARASTDCRPAHRRSPTCVT